MIKVNKCVVGPELRPQFFSGHHLAWGFEEHAQYLERLLTHFHFGPKLPQFAGAQIKSVRAEQRGSRGGHFHVRKIEGREDLQVRYGRIILRPVRVSVKKPPRRPHH